MVCLGLAILFWAVLPIFLKYLSYSIDPWTLNGSRYFFAVMFWLPYVIKHRRRIPRNRNIWKDAFPPAMAHLGGQILWAFAPYYNDAIVMNFVARGGFVFASLFGFLLLKSERPLAQSLLYWSGFIVALSGLTVMFRGGLGTPSTSALGMGLLIAASACWGLYSVLVRRFMHGYSVRQSYGVVSLYAGPAIIILMFLMGDWSQLFSLNGTQWTVLIVSGITGLAFSHVLFFHAIHNIGPVTSEGSLLMLPFITAVLAFFILNEHLAAMQWVGGIILVLGCILLILAKVRLHLRGANEEESVTPPPR